MPSLLKFGDITAEVTRKNIKNIHLSVYPPKGRVIIAAPLSIKLDTIRVFTIAKLDWIRKQQESILKQEREPAREFSDRESHYLWGKRYLLKVVEGALKPEILLKHSNIVFKKPGNYSTQKQKKLFEIWYRNILRDSAEALIAKWEKKLKVSCSKLFIQKMKTKWGSCTPQTKSIRLNTDLAKKPVECLEYIVVHELIHLIIPSHNKQFIKLMDEHYPHWQTVRRLLNSLPVKHESWKYLIL